MFFSLSLSSAPYNPYTWGEIQWAIIRTQLYIASRGWRTKVEGLGYFSMSNFPLFVSPRASHVTLDGRVDHSSGSSFTSRFSLSLFFSLPPYRQLREWEYSTLDGYNDSERSERKWEIQKRMKLRGLLFVITSVFYVVLEDTLESASYNRK